MKEEELKKEAERIEKVMTIEGLRGWKNPEEGRKILSGISNEALAFFIARTKYNLYRRRAASILQKRMGAWSVRKLKELIEQGERTDVPVKELTAMSVEFSIESAAIGVLKGKLMKLPIRKIDRVMGKFKSKRLEIAILVVKREKETLRDARKELGLPPLY